MQSVPIWTYRSCGTHSCTRYRNNYGKLTWLLDNWDFYNSRVSHANLQAS